MKISGLDPVTSFPPTTAWPSQTYSLNLANEANAIGHTSLVVCATIDGSASILWSM